MKQILSNVYGDPNVGLYGFCTDKYLFLPKRIEEKRLAQFEEATGLKAHHMTVMGVDLLGIFLAGNSHGVLISDEADDDEINILRNLGINVCVIREEHTAIGNLVICNDHGAYISVLLKKHKKQIEEALKVPVEVGMLAGHEIVGSIAVATNTGCLVHPSVTEDEAKTLEKVLKVPVDVGTVNFGSPFIKSGLLLNSHGMVVGDMTSGPEITRIVETLYR